MLKGCIWSNTNWNYTKCVLGLSDGLAVMTVPNHDLLYCDCSCHFPGEQNEQVCSLKQQLPSGSSVLSVSASVPLPAAFNPFL